MPRTLIVGATGHLGQAMVKACRDAGQEVHVLIRPATRRDPAKMKPLETSAAIVHEGDLADPASLLRAAKAVDAVISTVGGMQIGDDVALLEAAREAGVQRFIPSGFGLDPAAAGPGSCVLFDAKAAVQEAVKASGVPYTFVHCNGFFTYWAFSLGDLTRLGGPLPPPAVNVYGDGNVPGVMTSLADVARVTARAAHDPRLRNKEVRIAANEITQNLLIALGQTTTARTMARTSVPAHELERMIEGASAPDQAMALVVAQLHRSMWIRGDSVRRVPTALEATEVYPEIQFQTIEQALRQLV